MRITKKKVAALGVFVLILGGAAAAFAYFTSTGTANGTGDAVGSASSWSVTNVAATGTLYPGAGSSTLTYKITNPSSGHQAINSVTVTVPSGAGGAALDSSGTA